VRVAAGDVTATVGPISSPALRPAPGAPRVRRRDRCDDSRFPSIRAGFTGGIFVAAGDVNHDGVADLITSTDDTGGATSSQVKVFDGATNELIQSFMPFAGFTGSVRVGAGDLDGDGRAEIITGTGPGGSQVKTFDGVSGLLINSFLAYPGFDGGIFVAG